jgi:hypothetical protein
VIHSWSDVVLPESLNLRLPPIRLEINDLAGQAVPSRVFPHYLENVDAESRLQIAVAEVLNAYGTIDPDRDCNFDGIVDSSDIECMIEELTR